MLDNAVCQKARLSRDRRFDGKFFIAVKTTKIYCRPICPATQPKEKNVTYFSTAIEAANAGFRPCLRCRPDSAPSSAAWRGVDTTLERAIHLIDQGALQMGSLVDLSERLGIGERYLRQLFQKYLGVSPKAYAQYQQCLFAKQLLHQTTLSITQIALASGFNSVRRFNDCFKKQLQLSPSALRKKTLPASNTLTLKLSYRPPYDWKAMQTFLQRRVISTLEWCDEKSYGRTFSWAGATGFFTARHNEKDHCFDVILDVDQTQHIKAMVYNIRRILDVDADIQLIDASLKKVLGKRFNLQAGLRLPGTWSLFEAGIRAILGQQVSVVAAHQLVTLLVEQLGECVELTDIGVKRQFPLPEVIMQSDLEFLKMPGSRKQTLKNLAQYFIDNHTCNEPDKWLALKGIGPWTVAYAKMRGLSDPDVFLAGDVGVNNAIKALQEKDKAFSIEKVSQDVAPWRSYLTLHCWNQS